MINTPVLLIAFNRPDTTLKVFQTIAKARPKKLYVAVDGPRIGNKDDIKKCQRVKQIVRQVDWDCETHYRFSKKNLTGKFNISSAISWFFKENEEGIILEDDCLPCSSFFKFAEIMLTKYRHNRKIMLIRGTNYLFGNKANYQQSYYFSNLMFTWGWASWRRAWEKMELSPNHVDYGVFKRVYGYSDFARYWVDMLKQSVIKHLDAYDILWVYAILSNNGISIAPINNQISNIGYYGLHAKGEKSSSLEMSTKKISIRNLQHPKLIRIAWAVDGIEISHLRKNIHYPPKIIELLTFMRLSLRGAFIKARILAGKIV